VHKLGMRPGKKRKAVVAVSGTKRPAGNEEAEVLAGIDSSRRRHGGDCLKQRAKRAGEPRTKNARRALKSRRRSENRVVGKQESSLWFQRRGERERKLGRKFRAARTRRSGW